MGQKIGAHFCSCCGCRGVFRGQAVNAGLEYWSGYYMVCKSTVLAISSRYAPPTGLDVKRHFKRLMAVGT